MPRSWTLLRLGVALVVGVVLVPLGVPARMVTAAGFGAGQERLITWALSLYREARLPLPPVDFVHASSTGPCLGSTGVERFAGGRATITICTDDATPVEEFLFVHELAHAWDHAALGDATRSAFLQLRGLRTWSGTDPMAGDWHDRGAEHAAEIMTWGLMDRPVQVVYVDHHTCPELLLGYLTLVGRPPLHGFTDRC